MIKMMNESARTPFYLKRDFWVNSLIGATVAVSVLPQAIAFSTTLAGLPPYFGIYAAIWGVLIAAILNPAPVFHGGPNSTLSAVLGVTLMPIAPQYGVDYMGYAMTLVLMAGLVQFLFVFISPLAKSLQLMSDAVINGMICGIGLFLILRSLTTFGGLPINTEVEWPLAIAWQSFLSVLEIGNLAAIEIGLITLASIILFLNIKPLRPVAILAGILCATFYAQHLGQQQGYENLLLEQIADLSDIGLILPSLPSFSLESLPDIIAIIPGAITLALLGLVQTTAAMRRMNRMTGTMVSTQLGIAADASNNCLLSFLSALPSCASFNRMWLMQSMGANSRWCAISSAIILAVLVFALANWIALIPMPAMAAVIMVVGASMIRWQDIKVHFSNTPEALVFCIAFFAVNVLGLFGAVLFGSILALVHFKWRTMHPRVTFENNNMQLYDHLYYGSIPFIENLMTQQLKDGKPASINITALAYIDSEGQRWLQHWQNTCDTKIIGNQIQD